MPSLAAFFFLARNGDAVSLGACTSFRKTCNDTSNSGLLSSQPYFDGLF